MKKVLFIFPDAPLSESFSGQASRFVAAYQALIHLGYDVFVWRPLSSPEKIYTYEKETVFESMQMRGLAKSWLDIEYDGKFAEISGLPTFLKKVYQVIYPLIDPFNYCFPGSAKLRGAFRSIVNSLKPDLIWVETPFLGAVVQGNTIIPWIYQNHDFIYRLRAIRLATQERRESLSFIWTNRLFKHIEYKISSSSNFVVTGSVLEAIDIKKHGQSNVVVIPTTYRSVPLPVEVDAKTEKLRTLRIVHLGALTTTANYAGLKTYLEVVHPRLVSLLEENNIQVELVLVGDTTNTKPDLLELISKNHVQTLGFQSDLRKVLRSFDVSIIPYAENTGTRTKVPLLMNYAQVIIATENSVAGTPEVMQCNGCFFTKEVSSFLEPILQLALNFDLRRKMGLAAKEFFESHFTLESQLERYKAALDFVQLQAEK